MEQVGGQLLNKDKTPQRARKRNDKSGLTTITSTVSKNEQIVQSTKNKDGQNTARKIRSLFKETVSTKVKRQEKYEQANTKPTGEQGWNRGMAPNHGLPGGGGTVNKGNVVIPPINIRRTLNNDTVHHVSSRILSLPPPNPARNYRSKLTARSQRDEDTMSDGEAIANAEKAAAKNKKLAELNKFKLKKEGSTEDNGEYKVRTRLMIKLQKMGHKAEDVHSEDNLDNSFEESCSEISYDEEVDPEDEKERKARKKKKKAKKQKKAKFAPVNRRFMGLQQVIRRRPGRKPICNVFCTDYDVVRKAARNCCGFRLKEYQEDCDGAIVKGQGGQKLSEEWDLTWHNVGITPDFFSKLQPYQKVNQFPGIQVVTRKNTMARNLSKMKKIFPEKFKFFPRTWILPMEASEFHNCFIDKMGRPLQKQRHKTYIVKPDNQSQGSGIYLARNYNTIVENCIEAGGGWIVQDYMSNPHLIEDLKYDLRIYVLLAGLNPLRIYIHEEGLARFATEPYERPRPSNLDNMYVHLTNYSINKMNQNFKQNNKKAKKNDYYDYGDYGDYGDEYDDEDETGHKRSLWAILKIIQQQGGDCDAIMDEIKDIVVKTIITGQPYMNYMYKISQPEDTTNAMAFQILGFDIMIDKNFKPWLIEVNQSPSFATDSPLDYQIKKAVLTDTFNLLQISQAKREKIIREKNEQNAERIMTGKVVKMTQEERQQIRMDQHEDRVDHERLIINAGSGFELIFPYNWDDEKQDDYEMLVERSQRVWDDFTTGKKQRLQQQQADKDKQKKAEKEKKKKEESEEEEKKSSSAHSSDEEERKEEEKPEIKIEDTTIEQTDDGIKDRSISQHPSAMKHTLQTISEQASPIYRTISPLGADVSPTHLQHLQSNIPTRKISQDSIQLSLDRPASNPQGSPSMIPQERFKKRQEHIMSNIIGTNQQQIQLASNLIHTQLPEAEKLREHVTTLQNRTKNLLTQSNLISQDRDTTAAQKQYLEDIVFRQEQKIKYYQRIIEQQRILEGKIEQSASAINAAAYKSNTGFMAPTLPISDYPNIGNSEPRRHGALGGGGPPPSFMQRASHFRLLSEGQALPNETSNKHAFTSLKERDRAKDARQYYIDQSKSERVSGINTSRQSHHEDRLVGQVYEGSINPNINPGAQRELPQGIHSAHSSQQYTPGGFQNASMAQPQAILKAIKGEPDLTNEDRYRIYEQKLIHSQLMANKKIKMEQDIELEQDGLLIMRMEPQQKQMGLKSSPSKTPLEMKSTQFGSLNKNSQLEGLDGSDAGPVVVASSQRISMLNPNLAPNFASQGRKAMPMQGLSATRKPFGSPQKRVEPSGPITSGSLVMSGQSILGSAINTTGKKKTHVEQFMEYRNLVVQQQQQLRAGENSRNNRATSSQMASGQVMEENHGMWQSAKVAKGVDKKLINNTLPNLPLDADDILSAPLLDHNNPLYSGENTAAGSVKIYPQKQFVLNLSRAPLPPGNQQVFKLDRRQSKGLINASVGHEKRKQLMNAATASINGSPLKASGLMQQSKHGQSIAPVIYDTNIDSQISLREDTTTSPAEGLSRAQHASNVGRSLNSVQPQPFRSNNAGGSGLHNTSSPKVTLEQGMGSRATMYKGGGAGGGLQGGLGALEQKRISGTGNSKNISNGTLSKVAPKNFMRVAEQALFGLNEANVINSQNSNEFMHRKHSVISEFEKRPNDTHNNQGDRRISVQNLNDSLHIGPGPR